MTAIVDDHAAIAAELRKIAPHQWWVSKPRATCDACGGNGWMVDFTVDPPALAACTLCGNPRALPMPL